jgi:hypothetical protein
VAPVAVDVRLEVVEVVEVVRVVWVVDVVEVGRVLVELVVTLVEVELPPGLPKVDPISPQRTFEKITCVFGLFARIVDGLPSVLLQGPEPPLSSQPMNEPGSFQMLNTSTIPRPSASPMVFRPPNEAPEEQSVMESTPPDDL